MIIRRLLIMFLSLSAVLAALHCAQYLLYMGRPSVGGEGQIEAAEDRLSGEAFNQRCGNCHSHGGNDIRPDLPLIKAPQLRDFGTFLGYLRTPQPRDGSMNIMPPISSEELSDEEARRVYEGILHMSGGD